MPGHLNQRYLIALGSNMWVPGVGAPRKVLLEAVRVLERNGLEVESFGPVIASAAIGPSRRRYANGAAVIASDLVPPDLLALLQRIEREFGRRRSGQRWRARPLDLDIILWNGGIWRDHALVIPHPGFRERRFVLAPAARIAPRWRDPATGLRLRVLLASLTRPRPLPR